MCVCDPIYYHVKGSWDTVTSCTSAACLEFSPILGHGHLVAYTGVSKVILFLGPRPYSVFANHVP